MKNMIITAVTAAILTTTAANANDLAILGGLEYTTEAEVFEATVGVEGAVAGFTITPLLTVNDAAGDFEFTGAEVTVGYTLATSVAVYTTIEADADWDHSETTIGVSLRF
jgi:hypothetical protein